jgi:multicomponent Na+:H+ antiporter subunit C
MAAMPLSAPPRCAGRPPEPIRPGRLRHLSRLSRGSDACAMAALPLAVPAAPHHPAARTAAGASVLSHATTTVLYGPGAGASVTLVAVGGVLVACGVYLLLGQRLTRLVLGMILAGNGVNLLLLADAGPAGAPALLGPGVRAADGRDAPVLDPLPQAMILTAIVITLSMTAFLLALAYRTWQVTGDDQVQDDVEDRRIALKARRADLRGDLRVRKAQYRRGRREAREQSRDRRRELREAVGQARAELRARARIARMVAARAEDFEFVEDVDQSDTDFRPAPRPGDE